MVRIQEMPPGTKSGVARSYATANPGPFEDYKWLFMLNWNPDCPNKDVWIHGFMGVATRRSLREMLDKLTEMGFLRMRALRKDGHLLPKAKQLPDGTWVIVIADFFGEPANSSLMPL